MLFSIRKQHGISPPNLLSLQVIPSYSSKKEKNSNSNQLTSQWFIRRTWQFLFLCLKTSPFYSPLLWLFWCDGEGRLTQILACPQRGRAALTRAPCWGRRTPPCPPRVAGPAPTTGWHFSIPWCNALVAPFPWNMKGGGSKYSTYLEESTRGILSELFGLT